MDRGPLIHPLTNEKDSLVPDNSSEDNINETFSENGGEKELSLENILDAIKNGLFGVLFVVMKESSLPKLLTAILMIINTLQVRRICWDIVLFHNWMSHLSCD
jgi:hypothetical protein